jgi:hypothetical protein
MDAPLLAERIVEVLLQHSLSSDRMARRSLIGSVRRRSLRAFRFDIVEPAE